MTKQSGNFAVLVAAGILVSRLAGLVRLRVFSHYFGLSEAADAFNAAFRIPNLLQNLFGEGVLSASFIPIYSRLLARGEHAESRQLAGAAATLLLLITTVTVVLGIVAAPLLIGAIAPGFVGAKRELTTHLVRILFAGAGLLVFSAWCLGILNSHRRFFLSYAAPVIWNAAMIGTLLILGGRIGDERLIVALAWGSVAGSALQIGVQLPTVFRILGGLPLRLAGSASLSEMLRNFVPVFISRGVVQISAYIDSILASLLPSGAVSGIANAQLLYTLPVSLFGMSVSASELPLMSSAVGTEEEVAAYLRERLNAGLSRIAFFVVPCSAAFLAFGDVIAGALMQTGRFTQRDAVYVWGILAGSTVGLLASTMGRLYSSTYFALRDTRTPLRYALVRVALTTVLGYVFALPLPKLLGLGSHWGAAGLTASAGLAGWVEFFLLRRKLNARIGGTGLPGIAGAQLWTAAALAVLAAAPVGYLLRDRHPVFQAAMVMPLYGLLYAGATAGMGVGEARRALATANRLWARLF